MSAPFPPVEEQVRLLKRGAVDLVDEAQLRTKLGRSLESGKPLIVKTGFDPTSPDLHLGHTVLLRKMRHFQQLGHTVIFLVGDFTALIGDPSGKKATRPQLTQSQVDENAQTYKQQAFHILDRETTVVEHNSKWLRELGAEGIVRLAGSYTLARMMEREDFRTRFENQQPIGIHELLYPLTQGYDSVALEADVELGGHDQIFNLLVGRDLMKERELEPQVVLTVPLLVGTDGTDKMSKSLGNAIGVEDSPREMFGRTMSIPDHLMWEWFLLLTDTSEGEIEELHRNTETGALHPKQTKQQLASQIVEVFWGKQAAETARSEFDRMFARGGQPDEIGSVDRPAPQRLAALLADVQLAASSSEARRLVAQGAVSIDGEKAVEAQLELEPREAPYLLKVGKRRFLKVHLHG